MYLQRCMNDETMSSDEKIDRQVYTQLVELDSKLGTTASEQLLKCLLFTTRWDIITVMFKKFKLNYKKNLRQSTFVE